MRIEWKWKFGYSLKTEESTPPKKKRKKKLKQDLLINQTNCTRSDTVEIFREIWLPAVGKAGGGFEEGRREGGGSGTRLEWGGNKKRTTAVRCTKMLLSLGGESKRRKRRVERVDRCCKVVEYRQPLRSLPLLPTFPIEPRAINGRQNQLSSKLRIHDIRDI